MSMKFLLEFKHTIVSHHKNFTTIGPWKMPLRIILFNYRKNIYLNLQQKFCMKANHIICLLCGSTHVESNKIGFSIFGFFCDLL